MKLNKIVKYTGEMKVLSGIAVKGANNDLNIGGADSEVIKNPITNMPYIPGSSLKGKMRAMIEQKYNKTKDGSPCKCGRKGCFVCTIFGAHMNPKAESAPTRIIVRDCNLTEESLNIIQNRPLDSGDFLETKAENIINRDNGTAGSPRFMERVPAGVSFSVNISLQIFEGDDEELMKSKVEEALNLVQDTYLGGSGSRGYGQIEFIGEWK